MPGVTTTPGLDEFQRLAEAHTLVPLTRVVAADLETPVSAFLKVAAHEPEAFLLESVEGGEHVGRYTFIGVRPYRTLTARAGELRMTAPGREAEVYAGDVFAELKKTLSGHTPAKLPGLPPFSAGAVGFFAYDVVRQIVDRILRDRIGNDTGALAHRDIAHDHEARSRRLRQSLESRGPRARAQHDDAALEHLAAERLAQQDAQRDH